MYEASRKQSITSFSLSWDSRKLAVKLASGLLVVYCYSDVDFRFNQPILEVADAGEFSFIGENDAIAVATGSLLTITMCDTKEQLILRNHTDIVTCLATSSTGLIASGSHDKIIYISFTISNSRKPALVLSGHKSSIKVMAFSTDGTVLASNSADGCICTWNVARGTCTRSFSFGCLAQIIYLQYTYAMYYVLTQSGLLLRMNESSCQTDTICHDVKHAMRVPNSASKLIVQSINGEVNILRVGQSQTSVVPYVKQCGISSNVVIASNGLAFVSNGDDIKVTNAKNIQTRYDVEIPIPQPTVIEVSRDGEFIAVADFDYLYIVRSTSITNVSIKVLVPGIRRIVFSADSRLVACGTKAGLTHVWIISESGEIYEDLKTKEFRRDTGSIAALAFSQSAQYLASSSCIQPLPWSIPESNSIIRLWYLDVVCTEHQPMAWSERVNEISFGHATDTPEFRDLAVKAIVTAVAFSQDDSNILATCNDKKLRIWRFGQKFFDDFKPNDNIGTNATIELNTIPLAFCFNDDFTMIVVGMDDGTAHVWTNTTFMSIKENPKIKLYGQRGKIISVQFAANSKAILCTSTNGTIALHDLTESLDMRVFNAKFGRFSPGRDEIVSIASDGVLSLKSMGYYGEQFRSLAATLVSADIKLFQKQLSVTDISHRTHFKYNGRVVDIFESLHDGCYDYPDMAINHLLHDVPHMSFQLADVSNITESSNNMFSIALRSKDRGMTERIVTLLIEHASLGSMLDDVDHYTEGLAVGRLFPALVTNFPTLAHRLLEHYIVDTTPLAVGTESRHRRNFTTDTIMVEEDQPNPPISTHNRHENATQAEQVYIKTVLLPEVTNLSYWRAHQIPDPLEVLAYHGVRSAFTLQSVRGVLAFRWERVKTWFYLQFVLYLIFLGSCTAFTINMARDDVTLSLTKVYASGQSQTCLGFGFVALVINTWFLFGEIREFYTLKLTYFKDEWNALELLGHILVNIVAILHGVRANEEFPVAAVTILLVWFKMLSFFRGFRGIGVFTRLVMRILYEIK